MFHLELLPTVNRILVDPAFLSSVALICQTVPKVFKSEPRLVRAVGDFGALAMVVCAKGIASENGGQFTYSSVQSLIVKRRWASGRRVRAIFEWLEWEETVTRPALYADRRTRPLSVVGWLQAGVQALAVAYIEAARPWRQIDNEKSYRHATTDTESVITKLYNLLTFAGEGVPFSVETRLFSGHAAGFPLLLDLIATCMAADWPVSGVFFSRKAHAASYNVSRAHITKIFAKAEEIGILARTERDMKVSPSPSLRGNVLRDLAYQFASIVWMLKC
ncbi:hypothetical protein ACFSE1_00110 [Rhizobium helianthi]|uniref:MarR family transcriptional regulator n=1 Tax=Rhizobium helianthi TaxID=1132695 RepID=A0ABW4LXF6_9HYPH